MEEVIKLRPSELKFKVKVKVRWKPSPGDYILVDIQSRQLPPIPRVSHFDHSTNPRPSCEYYITCLILPEESLLIPTVRYVM